MITNICFIILPHHSLKHILWQQELFNTINITEYISKIVNKVLAHEQYYISDAH